MSSIYLVRHGQTDWNVAHRFQGQTDVPLNAMGIAQAHATANFLKDKTFDSIYTSDLSRARLTAEIIAEHHEAARSLDERLREIHFGIWEGWTFEQIKANDPDSHARWLADPTYRPEGAETGIQMATRITAFLEYLRESYSEDDTVLLVAHGGTLQVLVSIALGLQPGMRWRFSFKNAAVSKMYLFDDRATLATLNTQHFLTDLDPSPYEDQAKAMAASASV